MELTKNQKIISTLLEKSWEDPEFKAELIANPEHVIRETTGESLDLPEGKKLVIVDQTNSEFTYLNIPAEPDMDEVELSDEQLELIAGGSTPADIVAAGLGGG